MATASARLTVAIGFGAMRSRSWYKASTSAQSVSDVLGASECTAAIAACNW